MKRTLATLLVMLLAGCGSTPDGGPPPGTLDPADIEDAVPRVEPRSRYGNPSSYTVFGETYHVLESARGYVERGIASWYGEKFHGRRTSSGEPYDMYAMTAAHKTLPLPSYVRVTNLQNGRSAIVRVNDRGPFKDNRLIDLSYAAAVKLGILGAGTAPVEVAAIDPARPGALPPTPSGGREATAGGRIWLQVGAFGESRNAYRLLGRLQRAGFANAGVFSADGLHRVRIGPLPDAGAVNALSRRLARELGLRDGHVVVEP